VAQAQLLAYNGWVRCGRCQEVFNAESCLVELDAPPATNAPQPAPPFSAQMPAGGRSGSDFDLRFDAPPISAPISAPTAAPVPPPMAPPMAAPMPFVIAPAQPVTFSNPAARQPPPFSAGRDIAPHFGEDNMVERAVRAMRATPGLSPPVELGPTNHAARARTRTRTCAG
jgi:hypothetical protein